MNLVLKTIKNRRSWRSYDDRNVPKDLIETIISAGNEAPSGGNSQSWRFVVVESETMRKKLFETAYPKWKKIYDNLMSKPETAKEAEKYGKMEDPIYYKAPIILFVLGRGAVNCSLCCENMMIAAESLGLGSCYVYFGSLIKDNQEIVHVLELDEKEEIYGPILLGYPKGKPEIPLKKEPKIKWI
ncbi:nitroreductase family protein [Candidatus Bathyarchaeota archaeon]|nr:nitroreductase family protein [Candidatus Bathyarchaeota archaeon]